MFLLNHEFEFDTKLCYRQTRQNIDGNSYIDGYSKSQSLLKLASGFKYITNHFEDYYIFCK